MKLQAPYQLLFKVIAFALVLLAVPAQAQETKRIKFKAKRLVGAPHIGNGAKRLIGNVEFEHDGIIMYCDSAYMYEDNSLDGFGNIHITQGDTLHLYGDKLHYDGNEKKADVQKNIRLLEKDMSLTTDYLVYDLNTSIATYTSGGTIVNKENTLTSDHGHYHSNSKTLSFKKNVVLNNPQYVMNCDTLMYNTVSKVAWFLGPTTIKSQDNLIYCENGFYDTDRDISQFNKNAYIVTREQRLWGDSLYYDRNSGYGKAMRNVTILDSAQNIYIKGDLAEHFEDSENSIVTGNAVMMQVYDGDTLFLHGDTLRASYANNNGEVRPLLLTKKSKDKKDKKGRKEKDQLISRVDTAGYPHRMLFAYHGVKFFKSDMQGKCDSLVYSFLDSTMRLYKLPVMWSDQNQLTGDEMALQMSNGKIRSMELRNNAFISSEEDSAKFNQVKGRLIRGYFTDNELSRIRVEGNGQTIYFAKDDSTLIGVNKAECTDILILVKDNDIQQITFITKPEATLYPLKELGPKDLLLDNFVWRASERPLERKDIFTRDNMPPTKGDGQSPSGKGGK